MIHRALAFSLVLALTASAHAQPPHTTTHQASAPAAQAGNDKESRKESHKPIAASAVHNPILWHDPGNISRKNLFYGRGGEDGQPKPPFTFLDEDKNGSNP